MKLSYQLLTLEKELKRQENDVCIVYKGIYKKQPVGIKMVKINQALVDEYEDIPEDEDLFERFDILEKHLGFNELYFLNLLSSSDFFGTLVGYCIHNNYLYLVTEWIEHKTLFDLINAQSAPLTYDELENIFFQILYLLWYLHSKGIIHGDLHSKNILIKTPKSGRGFEFKTTNQTFYVPYVKYQVVFWDFTWARQFGLLNSPVVERGLELFRKTNGKTFETVLDEDFDFILEALCHSPRYSLYFYKLQILKHGVFRVYHWKMEDFLCVAFPRYLDKKIEHLKVNL
jgi:serine/threonine protein kinase